MHSTLKTNQKISTQKQTGKTRDTGDVNESALVEEH